MVIGEDDGLVLVPSVYVWPHVRVNCDPPWPVGIVYAPPFVVLQALAHATPLRALTLIAERPRSTQELAPLLSLSEAGLSKHLRRLADARVLEARREGYYVVYSLARARLEPLADALLAFIESERPARE